MIELTTPDIDNDFIAQNSLSIVIYQTIQPKIQTYSYTCGNPKLSLYLDLPVTYPIINQKTKF